MAYTRTQRGLYYIPIFHTPRFVPGTNIGAEDLLNRRHGPDAYQQYKKTVRAYFDKVNQLLWREVLADPLAWSRVHVFCDGLRHHDGQTEFEILDYFQSFLDEGSEDPLPELVLNLRDLGAVIHGTEDPEALQAMLDLCVRAVAAPDPDAPAPRGLLRKLVKRRDRYIARRINEVVRKREAAVLFIGALHRVDEEFENLPDVHILYPCESLDELVAVRRTRFVSSLRPF